MLQLFMPSDCIYIHSVTDPGADYHLTLRIEVCIAMLTHCKVCTSGVAFTDLEARFERNCSMLEVVQGTRNSNMKGNL